MAQLKRSSHRRRRNRVRRHGSAQVFRCYCRKEYMSYPALYLHVKLKHDHRIHAKDAQTRLIQKMGDSPSYGKNARILELERFSIKRNQKKKTIPNRIRVGSGVQRGTVSQMSTRQSQKATISQIIEEYASRIEETKKVEELEGLSLLFYLVKVCMNQCHTKYDERKAPSGTYCEEQDAKMLVNSFNFLVTSFIPHFCMLNQGKIEPDSLIYDYDRVILELDDFGNWLLSNLYTEYQVSLSGGLPESK